MPKSLLDGIIAFVYGIAAWFAWWFVVMLGFGESHASTVSTVYALGVPMAAIVGLAVGVSRGPQTSVGAVCVGWLLSLVASPPLPILANPAAAPKVAKLVPISLLVLIFVVGVYGAVTGIHFSQDRNRKRLLAPAIAVAILTVAAALEVAFVR